MIWDGIELLKKNDVQTTISPACRQQKVNQAKKTGGAGFF